MKFTWKRVFWILAGLAVVALIVVSFLPKPVAVETMKIGRGSMSVTVEAEGQTRVNDLFVVAAPVGGRVMRIDLEEGDALKAGTVVARITPPPADQMQRSETEARIESIEADRKRAEALVQQTETRLQQARRELERLEKLTEAGAIAQQELERARTAVSAAEQDLAAARAQEKAVRYQKQVAQTGRMAYDGTGTAVEVRTPTAGTIFRIYEKSERVVSPGTPLLTLGDPTRLEIVTDVLSNDAVRISPGDMILIDGWGGDDTLRGRVRYVEPSAFTKVSALGIEEQRVNVVGEFIDFPRELGDGYRVVARIVIWSGDDVLTVPISALFRGEQGWNVYVVENGRAVRRQVNLGHRNSFEVEVAGGLKAGERVILHPSNNLQEGMEVTFPE